MGNYCLMLTVCIWDNAKALEIMVMVSDIVNVINATVTLYT